LKRDGIKKKNDYELDEERVGENSAERTAESSTAMRSALAEGIAPHEKYRIQQLTESCS
jgi:hypothetical protein